MSRNPATAAATPVGAVAERIPAGWRRSAPDLPPEAGLLAALRESEPGIGLASTVAGIDHQMTSTSSLWEILSAIQRLTSWLGAEEAAVISELIERRQSPEAINSVTDEVATHLSLTGYSSDRMVVRAHLLTDSPEVRSALRSGLIDVRKADILLDGTRSMPPLHAREVHRRLIEEAATLTTAQLRKRVAAAMIAVDPAYAEERRRRAVADRTVTLQAAPDGMAWLNAYLPAPEAMSAFTAIDTLAGQTCADDDRPLSARRADAFSTVMDEVLRTGHTPAGTPLGRRQGAKPHLVVTVAESTLEGADESPARLQGYGPITATTARLLAESSDPRRTIAGVDARTGVMRSAGVGHGSVEGRAASDPIGVPTGGRSDEPCTDAYEPSAALRRVVILRDRTCRFPGCEQPGERCQLDHIVPFDPARPAREQTTASNLQLLCRRHHQLKTRGLWQVGRAVDGTTLWTAPTGARYARPAEVLCPLAEAGDLDLGLTELTEGPEAWNTGAPGTAEHDNPANLARPDRDMATITRLFTERSERLSHRRGTAGPPDRVAHGRADSTTGSDPPPF